jgi:hypothetical protein
MTFLTMLSSRRKASPPQIKSFYHGSGRHKGAVSASESNLDLHAIASLASNLCHLTESPPRSTGKYGTHRISFGIIPVSLQIPFERWHFLVLWDERSLVARLTSQLNGRAKCPRCMMMIMMTVPAFEFSRACISPLMKRRSCL